MDQSAATPESLRWMKTVARQRVIAGSESGEEASAVSALKQSMVRADADVEVGDW